MADNPLPQSGEPASQVAERRMREWVMAIQQQRTTRQELDKSKYPEGIHPYVAISRDAGADGSSLGERLSKLLGWELLDRALLDQMAEYYQTPRNLLEQADEKAPNWFEEVFGKWFNPQVVTQSEYIVRLQRFVWMAARSKSCVFVGRGCHLLLPSRSGLSIFVTAPYALRVEQTKQSRDCSHDEAVRYVEEGDERRKEFYAQHFHKELGDMQYLDLAVNLRQMDLDGVARLVADQIRHRFPNAVAGGAQEPLRE